MSKAIIKKYNFGASVISALTRDKLIESLPLKSGGYLVARHGVNKTTLRREALRFYK